MADTDDSSRSRAIRRTVATVIAGALALAGVVALLVRPAGHTRSEARFSVASPLVVSDAMAAIRTDGGTASTRGRDVVVTATATKRSDARAHATALARAGLDGARQRFVAAQDQRARTATADRARAAATIATLASRTGFTDPGPAYGQEVAVVQNLEAQRAAAVAAGQPVTTIDSQLAVDQQAVFELELQVTRHRELVQAESNAARIALDATAAINVATRAVSSAPVELADHTTSGSAGIGLAIGVIALVLAGVVLLVGWRRPRRAATRASAVESGAQVEASVKVEAQTAVEVPTPVAVDATVDVESERFLTFYRALAPGPTPELDITPVVDLTREEVLDEGAAEAETAPSAGEPSQVAGDANATKLSR